MSAIITVKFPDGKSKEVKKGITGFELSKQISQSLSKEAIALKANGYAPLKVKKDAEGDWILDVSDEDMDKPKFALWQGDEESDIILRIFNNLWDTLSDKLQRKLSIIIFFPT